MIVALGTDRPRRGTEYSTTFDRMSGQLPVALFEADLSVVITEGFRGGASLRVALEGRDDDGEFATVFEGPVLVEDHLMHRGVKVLETRLPRYEPRYVRLRYESVGAHRRAGELFAALAVGERVGG